VSPEKRDLATHYKKRKQYIESQHTRELEKKRNLLNLYWCHFNFKLQSLSLSFTLFLNWTTD